MNDLKYLVKNYLDYQCPSLAKAPTIINDNILRLFGWPGNEDCDAKVGHIGSVDNPDSFDHSALFVIMWVAPDKKEIGIIHPRLQFKDGKVIFGQDKLLENKINHDNYCHCTNDYPICICNGINKMNKDYRDSFIEIKDKNEFKYKVERVNVDIYFNIIIYSSLLAIDDDNWDKIEIK